MSSIEDLVNISQFSTVKPASRGFSAVFTPKGRAALFAGVATVILIAGAAYRGAGANVDPAATADPVVAVGAQTLAEQNTHIWSEFSGKTTAVDAADIRPEVSGRITEVRFKDGQTVKAGDILFVIDTRPYEAAAAKAEADLATANTNARLAHVLLDRNTLLLNAQAISRNAYDQALNASGVAAAAIKSAQAQLDQAKLDVDRAFVKAPISGRIGRAEVMLGNLVQAGATAPVLASIVSANGIYADFDVDEQTYMRNVHQAAQTQAQEARIPVELTVQGDEGHVYRGQIESFDNKIDTGSGTIRARARFDNKDGALVPGMFVSVKLGSASATRALLVPDAAVSNDQSKRFVYVVGADSKADFREVKLGEEVNGQRVVLSGLHSGERVITDGLQRLQPGSEVRATDIAPRKLASR